MSTTGLQLSQPQNRAATDGPIPKYELLWFPGSCARVTLIALEEIGVGFTAQTVPWNWGNRSDYLALNPKGKVPTLLIGGTPFTETPAIITHLAHAHPEAGLLPTANALIDTDVTATMTWFASGMHPLVARLRFPMSVNDDPSSFGRTRRIAAEGLQRNFAILEQRLSGRKWLYRNWSIIDGYLLWLWFRAIGSGMDGSAFPRCAAHARRCEQRPSVAATLDREEAAYAQLLASGVLPVTLPPYQVGRVPVSAQSDDSQTSLLTRE